jgi:hypothetical protein
MNETVQTHLDRFFDIYNKIPLHIKISQRYGLNHHPIWLIGNLIYHLDRLSSKQTLPEGWSNRFADDARPMPILTLYPTNHELLVCWGEYATRSRWASCRDPLSLIVKIGVNTGKLLAYVEIHHDNMFEPLSKTERADRNRKEASKGGVKAPEIPPESVPVPAEAGDSPAAPELKKDTVAGFPCPHCGRIFTKRFALTNHINGKHKTA